MRYWELLFDSKVLKRGREYHRDNRVRDLKEISEGHYKATVKGTHPYHVQITIHSDKKLSMKCSCPFTVTWADKCKHMAAVMYAIDELNGNDEPELGLFASRKRVLFPFEDTESNSFYFDMNSIAGALGVTEDEYQQAQLLLSENKYKQPVEIDFGYKTYFDGSNGCIGSISVIFYEDRKQTACVYRFSAKEILFGRCGCQPWDPYGRSRMDNKLCRHQAATLLILKDYIKRYDPGDSTDYTAAQLLKTYRNRKGQSLERRDTFDRLVQLEPKLIIEAGKLSVSFKIGIGRLYIIRKLNDLVNTVESGGTYSLGKSSEIDFSEMFFNDDSKEYYTLIQRYVEDERRRGEQLRSEGLYYGGGEVKQSIPLYGTVLDLFYDSAVGRTIAFKNEIMRGRSVETCCLLEDADPEIELSIYQDNAVNGKFQGIKVMGEMPKIYKGASHHYYLGENRFSRVSEGFVDRIQPLLSLGSGEVSFRVGLKNLSEFYYTVLPLLKDYVTVLEPDADTVIKHLSPKPIFIFYLDAQDGVPVCRAAVMYDDQEHLLSDWDTDQRIDQVLRNMREELSVRETVIKYYPNVEAVTGNYICTDDERDIYEALTNGVSALVELGEVRSTARFDSLRIHRRVKVSVGVALESDLLNLSISSDDLSPQELLDVLDSYRKKKTYHRLRNGEFINIDDSIAELNMMMEAMRLTPKQLISGKTHIPAYRALYLDKMLEQCEELDAARNRQFRLVAKDFRTVNDSDFEVPDSLRDIMRGYQRYGHKWLRTLAAYHFGGILADDMGLGKTLQVISVLLAAKQEGTAGTSIVITPASLVYNWQEEFFKFAPELLVCPIAGTQKERLALIQNYSKYDVVITSYDLLKRDISYYEDHTFFYEVIDEAQYIKNHTTAAAKSVKVLKSRYRVALTGTPIENRLSELWSIFDYLMPGFLYGYDTFKRELEMPIARKNDEGATLRLNRMVLPFILRRLKRNVLKDLPDKLEETRYTQFEEEQRKVYDGQVVRIREMLTQQNDESFAKGKLQILAELTRIRQICCDPSLLFENYSGGSAKREACLDLIQSAIEGEHRVLLFSQFTSMLELLERDLKANQIEYFKITGATAKSDRLELVKRFNEGNTPVFLVSLKAGGTGLNLTGADVVIHYDPWWNVAAQNQATDRAHRIGQEKVVTVYKMIVKNTIEERIQALQNSKQELADAVLNGDSVSIAEMTKEDLLGLLS